ncbi:MAG: adaptor protein MecA [Oscillospiraceae bacterium]|jgi:hypothetical protein|nr:adaptor protein MecA [Oscillospiraceae bacterium]
MTVHRTGRYSVAVFVKPDELAREGQEPDAVDNEWTRRLAAGALDSRGLRAGGRMEIEAFTGRGGLIVFAALYPESQWESLFYALDGIEEAIAMAVRLEPLAPLSSSLYYIDGAYVLSLSAPPEALIRLGYLAGEFGRRLYRPAAYVRFLREHGKTVLQGAAVPSLAAAAGGT